MNTQDENEPMELKHDPVPGYKPVFVVVLTCACLYLAFIFFHSPF